MSLYDGRITRRDEFQGEVTQLPHDLRAAVAPINVPSGTITPVRGFAAAIIRTGEFFASAIRPLSILYRFIKSRRVMRAAKTAKATAAPAVDLGADNAFQTAKEAQLGAHPHKGLNFDREEKVAVFAKLLPYKLAIAIYTGKIWMSCKGALISAKGAIAKGSKAVRTVSTYKLDAANGAVAESRFNRLRAASSADVYSVPAMDDAKAYAAFTAETTATAIQAAAVDVTVQDGTTTAVKAGLYSWFLPEQDGDTLQLFQVFSGVQSGKVLEVDMEAESAYWANNMNVNGVLSLVYAQTEPQTGNTLEVI